MSCITIISQIKRPVSNFTCHLCDFSPSFHISQKQHVGKLSPEFLSSSLRRNIVSPTFSSASRKNSRSSLTASVV
ncbi:hypothetical protein L1887_31591 [Cichorium endivia]|nr:hypothetical protein L1887_31591 [Cichorium endivia]